jgi:hypothetical protein
MGMKMLKVGDRVKLSNQGIEDWYDARYKAANPKDTLGTFVRPFEGEDFAYVVLWDNGCENVYRIGDLDFVKEWLQ